MKRTLLITSMILLSVMAFSQLNRTQFDEENDQEVLYGECTPEGFTEGEFGAWFNPEYENFEVNDVHFNPNYSLQFDSVYVFMASWCSDTQRELPRFCKIMDHDYFDGTYVRYFAFDGNKQNDVIDSEEFYVEYVPTFVFYYGGNELCRIIEAPRDSLEEDVMDLLSRIQD